MAIQRTEKGSKWHKISLCYPATVSPANKDASSAKTIIEVGPGRGDFLFHLAEANPDTTIIGIEMKSQRYFKLVERITKRKLANTKVIQSDARYSVAHEFDPNSIDEIHINFPDPWPKRRHTKNRLMNDAFMKDCLRILKKGGFVSFITDSKDYADAVAKCYSALEGFFFSKEDNVSVFPTYFAQKWMKEGRKFHWIKWVKMIG